MEEWIEIISVVALSAIKQLVGGGALVLLYGFSFKLAFWCMAIGGIIGITVFYYLAEPVLDVWMKIEAKIFKKRNNKRDEDLVKQGGIVEKTIDKFGLVGLAMLSPVLSYPLAMFLARRFFNGKAKILIAMYISSICWAVIGAEFMALIAKAFPAVF